MVKFSQLVDYFKSLAAGHVDIRHTEEENHFYRFELDKILTSLGEVNFPAMVLEGYDFNFSDSSSDNLQKNRNGAFNIIKYCGDATDSEKIHLIYDECEEIGDEIIRKMLADKKSRNVLAVRDFKVNDVNGNMIANSGEGYYGMRYVYPISSGLDNEPNPDKWI